jgi:diguanylate cyclase (GGDEF)-like protein
MRFNLLKQSLTAIATTRRRRRDLIEYRAFYDEVTGLPNRYLFRDRLEQALAQAQRRPCTFAVAFIDIDKFKMVNDAFGHYVGDGLLRHIGACLTTTLRAGDTAARLGGDEFVLLLLDISDVAMVYGAIDRINNALREPVRIDGHDLAPSCSIGISLFPQDGVDGPSLLKRADAAMYAQKYSVRPNPQANIASSTLDTGSLLRRPIERYDGRPS